MGIDLWNSSRKGEGKLEKTVKIAMIILLSLFFVAVKPGMILAKGEQSFLSQIDKDGESLSGNVLMQRLETTGFYISGSISVDDSAIIIKKDDSVSIYEPDEYGIWKQKTKLTPNDGNKWFGVGESVAISGDIGVVNACFDDEKGHNAGSLYIFERNGNGIWGQKTKLTASDTVSGDYFGWSFAVSGNILAVSAPGDDDKGIDSGSVYIFERDGDGNWNQKTKLAASDGTHSFGYSIAISENTIVVDSPGNESYNGTESIYIFECDDRGIWNQKSKLIVGDGAEKNVISMSLAISGNIIALGSYFDDVNGEDSGSVYIFERDSYGDWNQKTKLTASDGASRDSFGYSVAVSGNMTIVGSYLDDDEGEDSGSVYVFERNSNGDWSQKLKLKADDKVTGDWFGHRVAIFGKNIFSMSYSGVYRYQLNVTGQL
ncbi:MAG TPA: FG-GAP repeat protein, partial [Bacillota bacterium]|nr:FG-GAP repeat protein [Bacillota bacterium]